MDREPRQRYNETRDRVRDTQRQKTERQRDQRQRETRYRDTMRPETA